jgi:hypothetical protein
MHPHHLPFGQTLVNMKRSLKAGGALLILDLFRGAGLFDLLVSAMALPVDVALRLVKCGRLRESGQVRAAWDEHGRHDSYLTLSEIRKACADILPGANVTRHLLWRYSIIWKKRVTDKWYNSRHMLNDQACLDRVEWLGAQLSLK